MWALLSLFLAGCFYALLDGWYWIRVALVLLRASVQPVVRDILSEQKVGGRVLTTDLDPLMHMNNARYLREADFARFSYFARCGIFRALHALGAGVVVASSAARFRRSLRLLEPFQVCTRLLCWDEHAFYVEQRFVSPGDGRVCAVLLSSQHILRSTPEKVVQYLCKRQVQSPEFPEEVLHWISYNDTSSKKLRAESEINDEKDQ